MDRRRRWRRWLDIRARWTRLLEEQATRELRIEAWLRGGV